MRGRAIHEYNRGMKALHALLAIGLLAAPPAMAAGDPAVGHKLVQAKGCELCHDRQPLHGAKAIYLRTDRKVHSIAELRAQVSACNHGLHLDLAPDEERDVVAYLNREYYRFVP